jgi:hypothetical protein
MTVILRAKSSPKIAILSRRVGAQKWFHRSPSSLSDEKIRTIMGYIVLSTVLSTSPPMIWDIKLTEKQGKRWQLFRLAFDVCYNLSALIAFGCSQSLEGEACVKFWGISTLIMLCAAVSGSKILSHGSEKSRGVSRNVRVIL